MNEMYIANKKNGAIIEKAVEKNMKKFMIKEC